MELSLNMRFDVLWFHCPIGMTAMKWSATTSRTQRVGTMIPKNKMIVVSNLIQSLITTI